jgi:hypothetical protein
MILAYSYCPHCGAHMENRIRPDTVDFLRHLRSSGTRRNRRAPDPERYAAPNVEAVSNL